MASVWWRRFSADLPAAAGLKPQSSNNEAGRSDSPHHWPGNAFHDAIGSATNFAELEKVVHGAIGSSDLMEFVRFDAGEVLRKSQGGHGPKILRLVIGNPLIMKEMAKTVPDAASYAPVTILVDERADGVHLSYDSMESLLAPYGSQSALTVAMNLDAKVESLLKSAAS